jgi:hypothetical protein
MYKNNILSVATQNITLRKYEDAIDSYLQDGNTDTVDKC